MYFGSKHRFSFFYREERGISRDNLNPSKRDQDVIFSSKEEDKSYMLWNVLVGPLHATVGEGSEGVLDYESSCDIPTDILEKEDMWRHELDILYDHPHHYPYVTILVAGHELRLNSFHYDPANQSAPKNIKSKKREFIDIADAADLHRLCTYVLNHIDSSLNI